MCPFLFYPGAPRAVSAPTFRSLHAPPFCFFPEPVCPPLPPPPVLYALCATACLGHSARHQYLTLLRVSPGLFSRPCGRPPCPPLRPPLNSLRISFLLSGSSYSLVFWRPLTNHFSRVLFPSLFVDLVYRAQQLEALFCKIRPPSVFPPFLESLVLHPLEITTCAGPFGFCSLYVFFDPNISLFFSLNGLRE